MNTLRILRSSFVTFALVGAAALLQGADLTPAVQAAIDAKISEIKSWAADPTIVAAVVATPPAENAAMTQEKWKRLSLLDPAVRGFTKNEAAGVLKAKKTAWVNEAFVSNAKGEKVAFLSKPSNWSHGGTPKHDEPMAGKVWQGGVAVDESTGLQQLQVSVPVLKDGKPVGSIIVGINLAKL